MLTNKTWTDAYRGAGRPEATYAIERMMDELAAEVGVDPLEIREKNWITHGSPVHHGRRARVRLRQLRGRHRARKEMFGYDELRAEQKKRRDAGTPSSSASGSPRSPRCAASRRRASWAASTTAPAAGSTRACGCCRPARSRSSPASAHGQGHETAFSQIVAGPARVAFEDVEVLHGDTQVADKGLDTYGSRSLVVGGEALVKAVDKVIEKAKLIAAHLLEASADDVEFSPSAAPTRAWRWRSRGDVRRTTCRTAWRPRSTRTRRSTR